MKRTPWANWTRIKAGRRSFYSAKLSPTDAPISGTLHGPVRRLEEFTDEEIAELELAYGAKVKAGVDHE